MEELHYDLKTPFEYAFKGDIRTAQFLTVSAPTVNNIAYVGRLKQGFMQSIMSQKSAPTQERQESPEKEGSLEDLSGEMIMTMLSMSDSVDYAGYLTTAQAAFCHPGVTLIDGEEPLKKALMAKMTIGDLEAMTGEYLKVFILTSALEMM